MRQRILRVKGLLLCLETAEPVLAAAQMLSHLVRVSRDTLSVRALIRSNTQLLAAKVTERNAESGEHYITRNGKEYRQMLRAAAGGGAVMALATWGKLFLYTLGLSAFWGGLAAGINYSLAFVLVMLLHWTIATKQPAMTAPALAAKLRSLNAPGAIDGFVTEVMFLLRSQFAAIAGNLVLVVPLAWLLGLAFTALGDTRMMTAGHARHVIAFCRHHGRAAVCLQRGGRVGGKLVCLSQARFGHCLQPAQHALAGQRTRAALGLLLARTHLRLCRQYLAGADAGAGAARAPVLRHPL